MTWLVLACLFPGVIGAGALFVHEYRNARLRLEADTLQTARALGQAVDSHLLRAQAVVQSLSTSDSLLRDDLELFHQRARQSILLSGLGTNILLRDAAGRQLLNTAIPYGQPLAAPPAPEQVQDVFEFGLPTVSNLFMGPVLKRLIVSVDVPVMQGDRIAYALGVGIQPAQFDNILKLQQLPHGWIASILDSSGAIVARFPASPEYIGQQATPDFNERISRSQEGVVDAVSKDGVPVMAVYATAPKTGWRVAIGIPRELLNAALARTLWLVAAGVAVLFLVGLVLARIVSNRIRQSVQALTAPAAALGEGRAVTVPEVHIREAAEVASAIGRASNLLEERAASLGAKETELADAHRMARFGTWYWDLATDRIATSESVRDILGFQPESFAGLADDFLVPESAERLRAAAGEATRAGHGFDMEEELRDRSGRILWLHIKCKTVHDDAGKVVALRGTVQDIAERKLAEQRVRDAALHDVLTGLPNRALVMEFCEHLVAEAQRNPARGALLFIDLDRFKPINDLHGHETGDRVLKEVARRLRACTRKGDLVGRLGGDEFVIVLPHVGADRHRAATVARHAVDAISRPFHIDALELSISPSIGISFFPDNAADVGALIHTADMAMYQAKQAGRGTFQFYTPELDERAAQVLSLEARLRHAIRHGRLALHYQPVVEIASGALIGAEALVRLADGAEPVGPERFIPVAESAGLIGDLGEWVATEACRQHEIWQRNGLALRIAINVSPLQFRQRAFADRLAGIISSSGIDPSYLEIEVTESAVMDSLDEAVEVLNRIKTLGVKVSLDDFGTGYSSLSSLTSLPLDKLKVDQSFVRRIQRDRASRAVTEAIIALGRSLSLEVVGEGIESEDALRYLGRHGCNLAQGYLFSRPLPADEFVQWHSDRWGREAAAAAV